MAKSLSEEFNWIMKEDANRGWRMVIAHLEDAYKALCGTAGTQVIL